MTPHTRAPQSFFKPNEGCACFLRTKIVTRARPLFAAWWSQVPALNFPRGPGTPSAAPPLLHPKTSPHSKGTDMALASNASRMAATGCLCLTACRLDAHPAGRTNPAAVPDLTAEKSTDLVRAPSKDHGCRIVLAIIGLLGHQYSLKLFFQASDQRRSGHHA